MTTEAEEVLAVWRSAERVLTVLPDDAPERSALLVEIVQLRGIHRRLRAERIDATADLLHESRERIVAARRLIAAADARLRIAARRQPGR